MVQQSTLDLTITGKFATAVVVIVIVTVVEVEDIQEVIGHAFPVLFIRFVLYCCDPLVFTIS